MHSIGVFSISICCSKNVQLSINNDFELSKCSHEECEIIG